MYLYTLTDRHTHYNTYFYTLTHTDTYKHTNKKKERDKGILYYTFLLSLSLSLSLALCFSFSTVFSTSSLRLGRGSRRARQQRLLPRPNTLWKADVELQHSPVRPWSFNTAQSIRGALTQPSPARQATPEPNGGNCGQLAGKASL